MKFVSAISIIFAWLIAIGFADAQTWTQTGANTNLIWGSVGSSADGTKLAAIVYAGDGQGIYLSTNSGTTWALSCSTVNAGRIAISADGTKVAVEGWNGSMYIETTTNSGAVWSLAGAPPMGAWNNGIRSMLGSADRAKLFVFYTDGTDNSGLYLSTNWGATWSQAAYLNESWNAATCTADGTRLAAMTNGSDTQVYVSTDSGATWQPAAATPGGSSPCLLCTANGSELLAQNGTGLYVSTNWGVTWSETNNPVGGDIACSANGSLLFGMEGNPSGNSFALVSSTNLGVTWTPNSPGQKSWNWVACSADGNELIATATNGIWISQTPSCPQLNLASRGNKLNFSWIVPSTGMVLEESTDLSRWTTLTNLPSLNCTDLQQELTLPEINGQEFFRLVSQ